MKKSKTVFKPASEKQEMFMDMMKALGFKFVTVKAIEDKRTKLKKKK